jgi:tRNA (cmo5U34)-methyltransferase
MTTNRDTIYAQTLGDPGLFTFNKDVVGVFPDMINRSVPGYATVISMTGLLAARYARTGTRIYDLGCSLGASLLSAARQPNCQTNTFIGIDNSEAMLTAARDVLDKEVPGLAIELIESDILDAPIDNASVVIMNYTLQFVPIASRLPLLKKIRSALAPGDALILSEKIKLDSPTMDDTMIAMHHDFKRAKGYSDLEIAQKRQALENVLIPEPLDIHFERLKKAGFSDGSCWFQCFNFASMIAIA